MGCKFCAMGSWANWMRSRFMVCTTRAEVATTAVSHVRNFCSWHIWEIIVRNQRDHTSTNLLMWPITTDGKTRRTDQVGWSDTFAADSRPGLPYFCLRFCRQMHNKCMAEVSLVPPGSIIRYATWAMYSYSLHLRLIFRYIRQYTLSRSVH